MKIETNMPDGVHDTIKYPSIEKQVYDLISPKVTISKHGVTNRVLWLTFDNKLECSVEITKKGVRLTLQTSSEYGVGIKFGECEYPKVNLPYNKDVTKKIDQFCEAVKAVADLERRARAFPKVSVAKIKAFLNQELVPKELEVSFWDEGPFTGLGIFFYIHPKGRAPADGVGMNLRPVTASDFFMIEPFWNCSTPRRTGHNKRPDTLEMAFGHRGWGEPEPGIAEMKKKIAAVEALQAKLDAFDPTKSKDLMKLLELKREGDLLVEEFKRATNDKRTAKST